MVWCFNFLDWSMFERCALDFGGCACVLCYLKPSLICLCDFMEGWRAWSVDKWDSDFFLGHGGWVVGVSLCIHCAIQWWTSTSGTLSETRFAGCLGVYSFGMPRFMGVSICRDAPSPKKQPKYLYVDDPMIFFCKWAASKLQPEWIMLDFWSLMDTK